MTTDYAHNHDRAEPAELSLPATVFSPGSADEVDHTNQGAMDQRDVEKAEQEGSPASTEAGEADPMAYPTGLKLWIIMAALVSLVVCLVRVGKAIAG